MENNQKDNMDLYEFKIKTERNRFLTKKIAAKSKSEVKKYIETYNGSIKIIYIRSAAPLKDRIDAKFASMFKPQTEEQIKKERIAKAKKISPLDLARFLDRFAESIEASIKPLQIIDSLLQEDFTYQLKMILIELKVELNKGNSLNKSLSLFPGLTRETLNIIKIGEESGKLPDTLRQVSKDLKLRAEIKKKIKKGLTKPFFTFLFALSIVIFLVPTMVNPIKDMFTQFGDAKLPVLTRIVISATDFITNYSPYIAGFILTVAIIGIFLYKKQYKFKLMVDKKMIELPIIGVFIKNMSILKILVGINIYIQSSVPLAEALSKTIETVSNAEIKEELIYISREVDRGKDFSSAMSQAIYFNDYIKGEISVAEKEGSLVKKLDQIINILDSKTNEESDIMINGLTKTIGFLVAIIVGVVIIAVYSPMFSLMGEINKSIMEG